MMKYFFILLIAVSACGPKNDELKPAALSIALESEPRTIDTRYAVDTNSIYLEDLIYCYPFSFDPNGELIPELVKTFQWNNPKEFELTIKENVFFNDGTAVTIEDVKATYDGFLGDKSFPRKTAFKPVKSIEVRGKKLIFHLHFPDPSLPTNLVIGILPKNSLSIDRLEKPEEVTSCGPYQIVSRNNQLIHLKVNAHWSLGESPAFKDIYFRIVKDERTRYSKLLRGEIDLTQNNLNFDLIEKIKSNQDLLFYVGEGINVNYVGINFRDPLLNNLKIRQALNISLQRDKIIEKLIHGYAIRAQTILLPNTLYYDKDLKLTEYNVEAAKKILDEAGFPDPDGEGPKVRFTLDYKTTTDNTRIMVAKALGEQWLKIGVKLNIVSLDWGKFKDDVDKGRAQMWGLRWSGYKDPNIYDYIFNSKNTPPNGGNRGFFKSEVIDDLLLQSQTIVDLENRKKLFFKIQKEIEKEIPYFILWHENNIVVSTKHIKKFIPYADGRFRGILGAYKE